jgi:hypothetical protein
MRSGFGRDFRWIDPRCVAVHRALITECSVNGRFRRLTVAPTWKDHWFRPGCARPALTHPPKQGLTPGRVAIVTGRDKPLLDEALSPYLTSGYDNAIGGDGDYPMLDLPEGWTPKSRKLPFRLVREAARAGFAIDFDGNSLIDLRWFEDALPFLTRLTLSGPAENYGGLDAIREMSSLRYLEAPRTDTPIDLSGMPRIVETRIEGYGMLSVLEAPSLRRAYVDVPEFPAGFRVPSHLHELSPVSGTLTAEHLADAATLWRIWGGHSDAIDFTGLSPSSALEVVSLTAVKELRGLDSLVSVTSMRELRLIMCASVEPVSALARAYRSSVEIMGCPDLDDYVARRLAGKGWAISPFKRRSSKRAITRIERTIEGVFEVIFDDWGSLADRLGVGVHEELPVDITDLERVMRGTLERDYAAEIAARTIGFDSEGAAFRVQASSRSTAERLQQSLELMLKTRPTLLVDLVSGRR